MKSEQFLILPREACHSLIAYNVGHLMINLCSAFSNDFELTAPCMCALIYHHCHICFYWFLGRVVFLNIHNFWPNYQYSPVDYKYDTAIFERATLHAPCAKCGTIAPYMKPFLALLLYSM